MLHGLLGVEKPDKPKLGDGRSVLRLVMHLACCNVLFRCLEGDMNKLPSPGLWQGICVQDGEVLLWSSADLRCCFYIYELPKPWRKYMIFNKFIWSDYLGMKPSRKVYLCSRVVPMGWVSSTGLIQHIHRNLLLHTLPVEASLKSNLEIRKDQPLPKDATLANKYRHGLKWLWQVYLDNFDVLEFVADHETEEGTECEAISLAKRIYATLQVPMNDKKQELRVLSTNSLGVHVNGVEGTLDLPQSALLDLILLTLYVSSLKRTNKKVLQILAGRWVRCFLLRRPCFLALDEIWHVIGHWPGDACRLKPLLLDELLSCLCILPLARTELRLPFHPVVTVSDASLKGYAVCAGHGLSADGLRLAENLVHGESVLVCEELLLFSLFDGIGSARRALEMLKIKPGAYVTSDIKPSACRVVRYAWPDSIELGDVLCIDQAAVLNLRVRFARVKYILLVGGSPCQGLSGVNANRAGFDDPRTRLFYQFQRIHKLILDCWPEVRVQVLVENVFSMSKQDCAHFSEVLAAQPVLLDARWFGDCRRPRLWWFAPSYKWKWQCTALDKDRYLELQVLDSRAPSSCWLSEGASWSGGESGTWLPTLVQSLPKSSPTFKPTGIDSFDQATLQRWAKDKWRYPPYQYKRQFLVSHHDKLRCPTADERERL
eukprot:11294251-Karenia_brevis.AAC.1